MKKEINVIVKIPGKDPTIESIEDELEVYRKIVGGNIGIIRYISSEICLIHDDEGKLKNKEPNIFLPGGDIVVGPIVFAGADGEELRSLTSSEIEAILQKLRYHVWVIL